MPPIEARDFSHLRGVLIGISDRQLDAHLDLYRAKVRQLANLEASYPLVDWIPEGGQTVVVDASPLVATPVADLDLRPAGILADCLQLLRAELTARGVEFWPNFYLGEGEFWCGNQTISINVPWFLANPTLMRVAARGALAPVYSADAIMRDLRHELGHAIGYAFELWRRADWRARFGDFQQPYREDYVPDPASTSFVGYTLGSQRGHYAQKHPDEDWAETFATWLDPASAWAEKYASWPDALEKLRYIERIWHMGAFAGPAPNTQLGRTLPYAKLRGTVGELLGVPAGVRPFDSPAGDHSELLRREPALYNSIVLHESYFESLGGALATAGASIVTAPPPPELLEAAVAGWGSWESYLLDLRVIAAGTGGWAVTCWDTRAGRMRNAFVEGDGDGLLAGAPILLALDAHEHAYFADYGARKDMGVAAFFANVSWGMVAARLMSARLGTFTTTAAPSAPMPVAEPVAPVL